MQALRKAAFFAYGTAKFTIRGCLGLNKKDLEVDLTGRSFCVTGANSGIGYAACQYFASQGGTVHMVCRNKEKGEEAKNQIVSNTSNNNIHLHLCDVSEMEQIKEFVDKFEEKFGKLNVLVNCAGVMLDKREITKEGLDKTFATNYLSTFYLTALMVPTLRKSADPRVIVVSSGGALSEDLVVDDPGFQNIDPWNGTQAYAITKRQQIAITEKFSKTYQDIMFFSMHPGWCDTPGVQTAMPQFRTMYKDQLRSIEEGADTINWLSVAPIVDGTFQLTDKKHLSRNMSGEFFRDREIEIKHLPLAGTSYTEKQVDLLWDLSCSLTGFKYTQDRSML
eukprot:TRINITY_DN5003_c0_g1_i1.p1 TRINITY_DN5003_c0_g1~~TRINITY_DN5003_c0_g1_i1.p1  ORF type:complete len:335 (-),score=39.69 TRINITY_DN5003_c0_g1_i1:31-1035(-)